MTRRQSWALGIVGTLIVAIVLVVVFFDWNWLKGPIEAELSAKTGKKVTIEGPLKGEWSWTPLFTFDRVKIAAPDWKPTPTVATIDRIAIRLDIPKLLSGGISVPELTVTKPTLTLERGANGKANWDIATEAKGPSSRSDFPAIGRLAIDNGKLDYDDPAKHVSIHAVVSTVRANGGSGKGDLSLNGEGRYQNLPFRLKLSGGSIEELRSTTKPYELHLDSKIGNTTASIDGTITDPAAIKGLNVKLSVAGDSAADLYPLTGIALPQTPPYRLVGRLDRSGREWRFNNFTGKVGDSDLEGDLTFDTGRPRLKIAGDLTSDVIDFRDLGPLIGLPGSVASDKTSSETQRRAAAAYEAEGRVLPDAPLNLDAVRDVDADVTFTGKSIKAKDLPLQNVDLHLILDNARLMLKPLKMGVAGGEIDSDIDINARQDQVGTDYDIRLRQFQIQQFFAKAGYPDAGSGTIFGRIQLHGTGASVRKSLGSANGTISVISSDGQTSKLLAELLGLDVARAVGVLVAGDEKVPLRCMVGDFEVKDGLARPRIFVIDTSEATTTGSGTISLKDEKLDLALSAKPKSASPIALGGPINIDGTFKKPDAGLGIEAIARGGGAVALGVLLTPLASVIAFIDPGKMDETNCQGLMQTADQDAAKPPPDKNKPARRGHTGSSR